MASSKKGSSRSRKLATEEVADTLVPIEPEVAEAVVEAPSEHDEVLVQPEEVVQEKEAPDLRPCFTARQLFRSSSDPITKSFLHVEALRSGRIRKLPREDWESELKKFRSEER